MARIASSSIRWKWFLDHVESAPSESQAASFIPLSFRNIEIFRNMSLIKLNGWT